MHSSQPDTSGWRASPTCDAPLRARQDAIPAQALDEVCSQCCRCGVAPASLAASRSTSSPYIMTLLRLAPDAASARSGAERALRRAAAEPVPARHQRAPRPGAAPAARPHLPPHLLLEGRSVFNASIPRKKPAVLRHKAVHCSTWRGRGRQLGQGPSAGRSSRWHSRVHAPGSAWQHTGARVAAQIGRAHV